MTGRGKRSRVGMLIPAFCGVLQFGCGEPNTECDEMTATTGQAIRLEEGNHGLVQSIGPSSPLLIEVHSNRGAFESTMGTCTGTYVQDGVVLTAKHCFEDSDDVRAIVKTEAMARTHACDHRGVVAASIVTHPKLDLAVLFVTQLSTITPIAVFSGNLGRDTRVWLSGYGVTEDWVTKELRTIEASVIHEERESLTVQGRGGGACVGDSGGPLFVGMADGTVALAGSLWRGSATCLGSDQYVRLVAAREWLDAQVRGLIWRE